MTWSGEDDLIADSGMAEPILAAWIAKDCYEDKRKVPMKVKCLSKALTKIAAGVRLGKPRG
jgi:hypothetical protein